MRFEATISKGLLVCLILTLVPITAFSAQKITSGSICKVYKQKAMYQSRVYTCIKSGKKLVWNKGVLIVKPTPTPTPTPTPIPTLQNPIAGDPPLPLENCGYGTFYYRMNNGVMERSFYPDKLFTPQDSRSNLDFDPIRVKAYQAIRSHLSKTQSVPQVDFHISANFPTDVLTLLKQQLQTISEYWSDRFQPGSHIQASFWTEKDSALIDASNTLNSVDAKWVMDTYSNPNNFGMVNCGWRNGIAGAHVIQQGRNNGQVGYWIVFPTMHNSKNWNPVNLPHEFTHSIQGLIWSSNGVMGHRDDWVAYNFTEG